MPGLDAGFYYSQAYPPHPNDRRAKSQEPPSLALRKPRGPIKPLSGIDVIQNPLRGLPAEIGAPGGGIIRAAGMSSGWPLTFDYMARFDARRPKLPNSRPRSIGPYSSMLDKRFSTMKYDTSWYAYSDIHRPYAPSDLTGWPKHYKG